MSSAIYIEHPHVIAVTLGGNAKKPRLKKVTVGKMAEMRTEDGNVVVDREKHLADELTKFVKENKLSLGKAALLVGPDAMHYREFQIAFTDRKQIDRVIRFQAEGLLPSINIDDLAVAYQVLSQNEKGSRLLIMAADKEYIRRRLDALDSAGVPIDIVDCHLSGTLNLGLMHGTFAAGSTPALWLDFAGTTALVSIIKDGKVLATRAFVAPYLAGATGGTARAEDSKAALKQLEAQAGGGSAITATDFDAAEIKKELADQDLDDLVIDENEVEDVQPRSDRQPATPDAAPAPAAEPAGLPSNDSVNLGALEVADRIKRMSRADLLRFVSRVATEARRTVFMANVGAMPERLVVSGLGVEGGQLCAALGNELKLEKYESVDLLETINPVDEKTRRPAVETPDVGDLTYLCGVALKGMGHDVTGVDFRQGELAAGTMFDYIRTPLAFTATLVFLLAGIMFILALTQVQSLEAGVSDLRYPLNRPSLQKRYEKASTDALSAVKQASDRSSEDPAMRQEKLDADLALVKKDFGNYPLNEEDPAAEIRAVKKKLDDTVKRLKGESTSNFPVPHRADVIAALVMQAIESSEPSYDFALRKVDVTQTEVTVIFFASTSETNEELAKGNRKGRSEGLRVSKALESLALTATQKVGDKDEKIFDQLQLPEPVGQPKAFTADGRNVNEIQIKMPLSKAQPAKKPTTTGATK